jgi:hypothetical protein
MKIERNVPKHGSRSTGLGHERFVALWRKRHKNSKAGGHRFQRMMRVNNKHRPKLWDRHWYQHELFGKNRGARYA